MTLAHARSDAPGEAGSAPGEAGSAPGAGSAPLRIGDFAALAGVSSRTLRYYEERGIFQPSVHTAGGERRYDPADVTQLRRILELRDGLGLTLEEVRAFIDSERRLDALRSAYRATDEPAARARVLHESVAIRRELVARIDAKTSQLRRLRRELVANIARKERTLAGLQAPSGPEGVAGAEGP